MFSVKELRAVKTKWSYKRSVNLLLSQQSKLKLCPHKIIQGTSVFLKGSLPIFNEQNWDAQGENEVFLADLLGMFANHRPLFSVYVFSFIFGLEFWIFSILWKAKLTIHA